MRLAALKDAPHAFGSTYEHELNATETSWRERLANRAQLVAVIDGQVVGTAAGIASGEGTATLISMWVAPPARGRGVGARLVDSVVGWARDQGHASLFLWVAAGNAVAERLYERRGFIRTGKVQPVHPGDTRTEFEMWKRV